MATGDSTFQLWRDFDTREPGNILNESRTMNLQFNGRITEFKRFKLCYIVDENSGLPDLSISLIEISFGTQCIETNFFPFAVVLEI